MLHHSPNRVKRVTSVFLIIDVVFSFHRAFVLLK